MVTLSQLKREFITISKWAGLILGGLLVVVLLIKLAFFIKEVISPTPPPPPTVAFGKLPPIYFHEGIRKNFSYSLDTLTGSLPDLPDRSKVYQMAKPEPDILAIEKANEKVRQLGFDPAPEKLSDIVYRWKSPDPPFKNLILNVNLAEFTLSSGFITDPSTINSTDPLNEDTSISQAQRFLQTLELYPDDIDQSKTKTQLLSVKNGIISDATSLSGANLVSVFFFQKDLDNMPIVYPTGTGSTMNLVVAGGGFSATVVDGRFFYQKRQDKSATYPIKTSQAAFEELKKGNAYIASNDLPNLNIVIKKVYLAYYSQGREQAYLTPVIVFEGSGNFVAYVSAVTDEWINN